MHAAQRESITCGHRRSRSFLHIGTPNLCASIPGYRSQNYALKFNSLCSSLAVLKPTSIHDIRHSALIDQTSRHCSRMMSMCPVTDETGKHRLSSGRRSTMNRRHRGLGLIVQIAMSKKAHLSKQGHRRRYYSTAKHIPVLNNSSLKNC